jgi:hypothetical protein
MSTEENKAPDATARRYSCARASQLVTVIVFRSKCLGQSEQW